SGAAAAPATDRGLADPQLGGQFSDRLLTSLDVGSRLRRRRGVGVQVQFHDTRHSLTKAMPRSTPIPSNQSPGTKHEAGTHTPGPVLGHAGRYRLEQQLPV